MSVLRRIWPRELAATIILRKTPAERSAELQRVPEEYRAWVKHLVEDYYAKRKYRKQR